MGHDRRNRDLKSAQHDSRRLDEARRLPIARVLEHPLWWDASKRLEKISEWKAAWWDRDRRAALKQRLAAHQRSWREIRGTTAAGWLARLDDCVVERWGVVATPMFPIRLCFTPTIP